MLIRINFGFFFNNKRKLHFLCAKFLEAASEHYWLGVKKKNFKQ